MEVFDHSLISVVEHLSSVDEKWKTQIPSLTVDKLTILVAISEEPCKNVKFPFQNSELGFSSSSFPTQNFR